MSYTPPTSISSSRSDDQIRGSMGALEIAFFTVASAGPLLVIAGIGPIAFMIGGAGAVGAQFLAGIALLFFAVGLTKMAARIRNAGAFYAYVGQGLGRPIGGGAALLALFTYSVIAVGQFGAVAAFTVGPVEDLTGIRFHWAIFAFLTLAIVAYLGHRQISLSARVLGVALIAEVVILLVLALPVLLKGGASGLNLDGFAPDAIFGLSGSGAVFAISFGAFIGFESSAIYSEEAKDPVRTIPRAIYLAVGFLTVFYGFMMWIVASAFGSEEVQEAATADPVNLVFAAMESYVGHPAVVVAEVLLITSAFASTLAFHNTATRYLFSLGRESLLPRRLSRVHAKHHSPYIASAAQTAIASAVLAICVLLGADPYLGVYLLLVAPGILAVVALQALCSLAIVVYFRKAGVGGMWSTLVAPLVSFLALSAGSWLILSNFEYFTGRSGSTNWLLLGLVPAIFAVGVARTLYLRKTDRSTYEKLTERTVF